MIVKNMDIQYCSDLHLEFQENKELLTRRPLSPKGEVLLLAGDIVPFVLIEEHGDFFDFLSDNFQVTYWVPGNHEYYHFDLADRSGSFCEKIRSNVFLLNNTSIIYKNICFLFSTLWSKISPPNQWMIQQGMADFHLIQYMGKPITMTKYIELHTSSLNYLKDELAKGVDNTVVVTHHVPTFLNYPEKYKNDILSEAFATELFDLIYESSIRCWIYGHHHQPVNEFEIGCTKLINNQLGYVQYNEHRRFDTGATLRL